MAMDRLGEPRSPLEGIINSQAEEDIRNYQKEIRKLSKDDSRLSEAEIKTLEGE